MVYKESLFTYTCNSKARDVKQNGFVDLVYVVYRDTPF